MAETVDDLLASVKRGCADSVGSGRPEAVLREAVQPVLEALLNRPGQPARVHNEARLMVPAPSEAHMLDAALTSVGRADAVYNRFVVEFEPPGSLRPSLMHSATKHALTQVKQYLRGVSDRDGLALERLAGCAFDGTWIVYVSWERGAWQETRPRSVDVDALRALIDALASLATGRGLTADNLDQDFGRQSECARRLVPALHQAVTNASPRTAAMFAQWRHDLAVASGPFSTADVDEWQDLCTELSLPADASSASHVLFALQTYFSLVSKLVALIILEGATGQELVAELRVSTDVFGAFGRMEDGAITRATGAVNVLEPGIFSWYVDSNHDALPPALEFAAALAAEYSAEIVEVTPLAVRDVLKDLYQRMLPRSIRHRLGEYYTPDWVAERLVELTFALPSPLPLTRNTRVVDPACGSGTFLIEIINRQLSLAPSDDPTTTLELILQNVVGFDVSPLAVQAAKVNYVLALAPVLKSALRPVIIPVFLADSVSPPRRGDMFEGDVFVFESSEGVWRVPSVIVERGHLPAVGAVLSRALVGRLPRPEVEAQLQALLTDLSERGDVIEILGDVYDKLMTLHELDRNGMWWQILSNAFAPILQGSFDVVIGNPPWVSWETLPEEYRRANDGQWLDYGLRPDAPLDRRQASRHVLLDLSMLFVARSMDRLLVPGGRLGFVITSTVFKSELAGRGFRRFKLPQGRYRLSHLEDLSRMSIFDHATNQTTLMVATKDDAESFPVSVVEWGSGVARSRAIPTSLELNAVLGMTSRTVLSGEPVSPGDAASPLLVLPRPALELTRGIRRPSYYAQHVRNGIHTRGANGIFFVEVLEMQNDTFRVRNIPGFGRNSSIPVVEGWVESQAVCPLLRGEDVRRGQADPEFGLLFFHDADHLSHSMSPEEVATRLPLTFSFISHFAHVLRSRHSFRNFDPSGNDWLGLYSVTRAALAAHKVVFREIARGTIAAAVHSAKTVPDHKLYVILGFPS